MFLFAFDSVSCLYFSLTHSFPSPSSIKLSYITLPKRRNGPLWDMVENSCYSPLSFPSCLSTPEWPFTQHSRFSARVSALGLFFLFLFFISLCVFGFVLPTPFRPTTRDCSDVPHSYLLFLMAIISSCHLSCCHSVPTRSQRSRVRFLPPGLLMDA